MQGAEDPDNHNKGKPSKCISSGIALFNNMLLCDFLFSDDNTHKALFYEKYNAMLSSISKMKDLDEEKYNHIVQVKLNYTRECPPRKEQKVCTISLIDTNCIIAWECKESLIKGSSCHALLLRDSLTLLMTSMLTNLVTLGVQRRTLLQFKRSDT